MRNENIVMGPSDTQIDAFWDWFRHNSRALRKAIRNAERAPELDTLDAMVSAIYAQVAQISEELVIDVHVGDQDLTLSIRTGLADQTLVRRILAKCPEVPGWRFAAEIPQDFESVVARDHAGREVVLPYAALRFAISDETADHKRDVLIVFDHELNLGTSDQAFLDDVAAHILTTFLGRIPSRIGTYALVPARMARGQKLRPIFELPKAWAETLPDAV